MNRHKWTAEDCIIGYYLARFGERRGTLFDVSKAIGINPESMEMRVSNFNYLMDNDLSLYIHSTESKMVFDMFKDLPDKEAENAMGAFIEEVLGRSKRWLL